MWADLAGRLRQIAPSSAPPRGFNPRPNRDASSQAASPTDPAVYELSQSWHRERTQRAREGNGAPPHTVNRIEQPRGRRGRQVGRDPGPCASTICGCDRMRAAKAPRANPRFQHSRRHPSRVWGCPDPKFNQQRHGERRQLRRARPRRTWFTCATLERFIRLCGGPVRQTRPAPLSLR